MILLIPYHRDYLQDETRLFGRRNGAELRDITNDATFGYWRLFSLRWTLREPFAICEHDVVPTDAQWRELRDCAEPWCIFPYERLGVVTASLGFCKFVPDALGTLRMEQHGYMNMTQEAIEKYRLAATPPTFPDANIPWNHVDGAIFGFLTARKFEPHRHETLVRHIRERRPTEV